jgi:hypothetical protein
VARPSGPTFTAPLGAITAEVVGVILNLALFRWRVGVPSLLAVCALAGVVLSPAFPR